MEGEDREQLGDRQKTRKLNSSSNDSCLLCASVGYMEIGTTPPCLHGVPVPDTGWSRESVAETEKNKKGRVLWSRPLPISCSLGVGALASEDISLAWPGVSSQGLSHSCL